MPTSRTPASRIASITRTSTGLLATRNQLFRARIGQRIESCAFAAAEDKTLHRRDALLPARLIIMRRR